MNIGKRGREEEWKRKRENGNLSAPRYYEHETKEAKFKTKTKKKKKQQRGWLEKEDESLELSRMVARAAKDIK